jgi:hypothetical protein
MAARKKPADTTGSLFIVPPPVEPSAPKYDSPVVAERTLRVVPPPAAVPENDVAVEPTNDGRFVVTFLRHHGTTFSSTTCTREMLELLLRRIPAALEVG